MQYGSLMGARLPQSDPGTGARRSDKFGGAAA